MTQTITNATVEETILGALATFGAEADQLSPDATFESLDVDSLDLVELAQVVQDEFGVKLDGGDISGLKTVGDAIDLVVSRA
jgi:acyl carrier protein